MNAPTGIMLVLAQDAYDANQYRGVIGASKEARAKSKAEGDAARAAVAELVEAMPDLLALYRLKWGNLDTDANKAFERASAALAKFKEA